MPRHRDEPTREREAERLRRLRATLGLSQRELAAEFQVASGAVAQWEAGARTVPGPVLRLVELYEEELAHDPSAAARALAPAASWVGRTVATSAGLVAWLTARALAPAPGGGAVARRMRDRALERYVATAARHKGLAMKWAQLGWALDVLLDEPERRALAALRVAAPALTAPQAARVFFDEFGVTPRDAFAAWSPRPFACASVGQVHAAVLRSGARVAVKIQYPRVAAMLDADVAGLQALDRLGRVLRRGQVPGVLYEEFRRAFVDECDYRLEARHQARAAGWFRDCGAILVPAVVDEWSSGRVLTTDLVEGQTLEDFAARATQAERDRAGDALWTFYYRSVLAHGAFNADPHPGNFVFGAERVAFLDFGRVKVLSEAFVRHWHAVGRAVLERDRARVERALVAHGYVAEPARFDYRAVLRLLWLWARPCLRDEPFAFTPAYLRALWRAYADDPSQARVRYTGDMAFLMQLLFGVGSTLARLGARVACRASFVALLYAPGEPVPPPYSHDEIERFEAGLPPE